MHRPLFIPISQAVAETALSEEDVRALIRAGEIVAVKVRGQELVVYDSLWAFAKRLVKEARA